MKTFYSTYTEDVIPAMKDALSLSNIHEVPRIKKVTVNVGVGRALSDSRFLEVVENTLTVITGQKPLRTKARKSIAGFKLREGMTVGVSVTLRGARMYDFLHKLIHVTFPRVRDFRGIPDTTIDPQGNLNIGLRESSAFPEVRADEIENIHPLQITVTTTARDRDSARELFDRLGFPFKKEDS